LYPLRITPPRLSTLPKLHPVCRSRHRRAHRRRHPRMVPPVRVLVQRRWCQTPIMTERHSNAAVQIWHRHSRCSNQSSLTPHPGLATLSQLHSSIAFFCYLALSISISYYRFPLNPFPPHARYLFALCITIHPSHLLFLFCISYPSTFFTHEAPGVSTNILYRHLGGPLF